MAKKIKFNLHLNGNSIKTLDDLRNNFNVDDMLINLKLGILPRWLSVRGFNEQLKKVAPLDYRTLGDLEIAKALIHIFDLQASEQEIKEALYFIHLIRQRQKNASDFDRKRLSLDGVIARYHDGYSDLLSKMKPKYVITESALSKIKGLISDDLVSKLSTLKGNIYRTGEELMSVVDYVLGLTLNANQKQNILAHSKEPQEFALIKATVREIVGHYRRLFEIDAVRFYEDFAENEPLAIFAVLMNRNARDLFLKNAKISQKLIQLIDWNFLNSLPFKPEMEGRNTTSYWDTIREPGKEYLIIRIESGSFVQNVTNRTEKLSYSDVNGKFPILNGINYRSPNPNHKLVFLPCSRDDPLWIKPKKE